MRPKSIVLLMLALGCGLIASIGINQVLANRSTQKTVVQDTTPIYVVQSQVELGIQVKPEMLKLEPWPTKLVPEGAITSLSEVEGRVTRARIFPGEPILANKLFSAGDSTAGATVLIPEGFRVTPVKVDLVSGGSGLLQPGDRVDILVYLEKNEGKDIPFSGTITLLQDVRVFAVNAQFRRETDEPDHMIMAKTISLLLTPEHVEMVTLAANMGDIHLVLRSPEDDVIVKTLSGQTAEGILKLAEASNRDEETLLEDGDESGDGDLLTALNSEPVETEPAPEPVAVLPAAEPDWTMILLVDGEASRVTFIDGFVHTEPLEQATGSRATAADIPASDEEATSDGDDDTDNDEEADDFDNFDEFDFGDDDSSVG